MSVLTTTAVTAAVVEPTVKPELPAVQPSAETLHTKCGLFRYTNGPATLELSIQPAQVRLTCRADSQQRSAWTTAWAGAPGWLVLVDAQSQVWSYDGYTNLWHLQADPSTARSTRLKDPQLLPPSVASRVERSLAKAQAQAAKAPKPTVVTKKKKKSKPATPHPTGGLPSGPRP